MLAAVTVDGESRLLGDVNHEMNDQNVVPPATYQRASRVGKLTVILGLSWAITFTFFKASFSPSVYWMVLIGVSLLIGAVPCWLVGQRAKRQHLREQAPVE